jgi:hypothetical protein
MSDTDDLVLESRFLASPEIGGEEASARRGLTQANQLAEENGSALKFDLDSGAASGGVLRFEPSQASLSSPSPTRKEMLEAEREELKLELEIEQMQEDLAASRLRRGLDPALSLSDLDGPPGFRASQYTDPAFASFLRESAVATQQRGTPSVKLRSTETPAVYMFLAYHNPEDLLPAWQNVDTSLRAGVAFVLGHVGKTLSEVYGDEIGPDQRFLRDMNAYLLTRSADWEEEDIIKTFAMKPMNIVSTEAVTTACASLLLVSTKFEYFFTDSALLTLKDGMHGRQSAAYTLS